MDVFVVDLTFVYRNVEYMRDIAIDRKVSLVYVQQSNVCVACFFFMNYLPKSCPGEQRHNECSDFFFVGIFLYHIEVLLRIHNITLNH